MKNRSCPSYFGTGPIKFGIIPTYLYWVPHIFPPSDLAQWVVHIFPNYYKISQLKNVTPI
jgi:hypothetical protein